MTLKSCIKLLTFGAAISVLPTIALAQTNAPVRQRISVYPFDDRTLMDKDMNKEMKIGTKLADSLIAHVTTGNVYTVIDRQYLERILQEKNFKYDPNFDSAMAAKAGLLGTVDTIASGQIDAFSANVKTSEKSNVLYKTVTKTASVDLKATVRFISVERGSIVAAPEAHVTKSVVISSQKVFKDPTKHIPDTSIGDDTASLDQSLRALVDQASDEVAKQLSEQVGKLAESLPPPTVVATTQPSLAKNSAPHDPREEVHPVLEATKCLGVEDGLAIIAEGSADGVKPGDKFKIRRISESKVTDVKGNPIIKHKEICTMTVSSVEDHTAEGKCAPMPTVPRLEAIPKRDDEAVPLNEKPSQVASNGKRSTQ